MTRVVVLAVLIAAGGLSLAIAAQQAPQPGGGPGQQIPPSASAIQVEKLKDNLFVLQGGGGNTAVFLTATGVVVVDTKNPGWGQPVLDKIKELTDKPVTTIINTHTHADHVSGNVAFPATVEIVTHENTKTNMDRMASPPGMGSAPPPAQTMHAGDLFARKGIPTIDTNNGGSGLEYPETLTTLHAGVKNVSAIITGHSTVMTWDDLREYADFNRDFLNAVREAKKAGKTVDEIATSWTIPAKYAGYAAPQPERLKINVQAVYDELK
jgi:cyclase